MSIIGKQLPEFTLDAFKKPELVKVSTADVLGKSADTGQKKGKNRTHLDVCPG